ncbi:MAG: integrase [Mycobacterium pseudokansasii]|uniref:tyrosine-type recombinase/integrase n=1 Tax=Mycobacterium pseudokansasii TaxID=2341080 RepID=UPI0023F3A2F0|nr:integrase [Mycobacterium pseudokansasii]MBY0389074.1 integrase [Mycobacterium pseudokansasii]
MDGLAELLDEKAHDHRVLMTQVLAIQNERVPRSRVVELLADLNLIDHDADLPIDIWIEHSANEFPPGFGDPVRQWLSNLCHGSKRDRPRTTQTAQRYFSAVRPFLHCWAGQYTHLREVNRSDIHDAVDPLQGFQRNNAIASLRSLFRFAKRKGIVFVNPTTYFETPKLAFNPLPMSETEIRAVEQAAKESPMIRLVVALAAEHGARAGAIRTLTFDDIDLPNRRIVIAGHNQRLGALTHHALSAWLEYRRAKWPHSPNRHLLISGRSAPEAGPVSSTYFRANLYRKGFKLDPIREDRILHEALTAAPDPLHLTMIFGITHATAMRYAHAAQAILEAV